jgi:hypothetical protein
MKRILVLFTFLSCITLVMAAYVQAAVEAFLMKQGVPMK